MKGKKLIKYVGGVALLGVFSLGVLALPDSYAEKADAATLSGTVFEDEFSEAVFSNQWLKNDFCLDEESYYSMRFDNQKDYGSAMLYKDYVIRGDCVITFDFYQSEVSAESKKSDWFGILFGYSDDSAHFTNGNAAILSYERGQTQMMDDGDGTSKKLVADSYNDHAKFANSFNSAEEVSYCVKLVISYTGIRYSDGENLYRVDGYYHEKGATPAATPKFSYKAVAAEGYFGFSAMASAVIDISNLEIFEGDQRVAYENFQNENGEGKKLVSNAENSQWKSVNSAESKLYSYFNGRVFASEAEGLMLSSYDLKADTLNKKTFEVSFDAELTSLPVGGAFGVAFGLSENALSAREGSFVGVQGVSDDSFAFVHIQNGETVAQTNPISKQLYGAKKNGFSFVGCYDGSVEVKLCGYTASFENAYRAGCVGVATLGQEACAVYFDNFNVSRSSYVSTEGANSAINFTGVKETYEDDFVYVERYIDEKVWYLGSGVAFPKVYRENDNYIQVVDANERTFFGAKQTYSEFICRFSVTVTQNRSSSAGAAIGLSFGKDNRNDSAKESASVMFAMTEEGMILQGYNGTLLGADANGILKQYQQYPQLDFWSEESWTRGTQTYRVMVVARGGNAYVYYANENDLSQMNVCKAVMTDLETSGYVTLSALGGATFRLNDFSVTNIAVGAKAETLSVGANEEDCEYVNVNFKDEAMYSSFGSVTAIGNGASLAYSSKVSVNERFTDFLAYVDVNAAMGNGIELQIGNDVVRLNADGTVYSQLKKLSGSGKFDFSTLQNGGIIMVEAIGGKISIGIVGKNLPCDLLENSVAVFEATDAGQSRSLSVATVSETVLSLESIRMYTLKPTIAIQADNWEASDTMRPNKNAPAGSETTTEGKGCSSAIVYGAILPTALWAAAVVVWKKREAQDE